jgi:ABC-2 type transport system ATP-binding protein
LDIRALRASRETARKPLTAGRCKTTDGPRRRDTTDNQPRNGVSPVIEAHDLTKKYGELYAVKTLELDLQKGDVFGFIGPNGAGKTTTMRILATLLNPTWGEAYVCGYSIYTHPRDIRRLIGYMPDFFGVYDDMKVIEYLEFFAAAYRIGGGTRRKICNDVLELVELGYKREALVTSLSRGMTQRLGLARVLLHDPQVLLLDEPASGLDPRARIEIRGLLKRLRDSGKTIMVSSHILPELADICNKIGIIERGELIVNANVAEVMKQVRRQTILNIGMVGDGDHAARLLKDHPDVENVEPRDGLLVVTLLPNVDDYSQLTTLLVERGIRVTLFKEEEMNLETAFMALTKGITA